MLKNCFYLLLFTFLGFQTFEANAQKKAADGIVGTWLNQDKDAHIRIYLAKNGKYYGKLEWMKNPNDANGNPKKDVNNPDKTKQDRLLKGILIVKGFTYDAKSKEWINGRVYDSKSGNTYSGYMKLNSDGSLYLKGGYKVFGMIVGRENTWTRVE